jgi:hypothetical protein
VPDHWSDTELKALVEFVLFHGTADKWPKEKHQTFGSSQHLLGNEVELFVEQVCKMIAINK